MALSAAAKPYLLTFALMALSSCPARAALGDAQAAFDLGLRYDQGAGVPEDPAMAFRCYRAAAAAQLPSAEFNVAVMFDSGHGTAHDVAEAATWYARAATHGHARSQYDLAQLYASGQGVPRNPAQAAAWFRAAAAHGVTAADARLAATKSDNPRGEIPVAAVPVATGNPVAIRGGTAAAELVWLSPRQNVATRFFVTVLALAPGSAREVFSGFTDLSAMAVDLPATVGAYAWRVYTVADAAPHYAASEWQHFSVVASAPAAAAPCG